MKNWLSRHWSFFRRPPLPEALTTRSLSPGELARNNLDPRGAPPSPKRLMSLALYDPYGEGQPVHPQTAELLGMFEERAVSLDDLDPDLPTATRELLGEGK